MDKIIVKYQSLSKKKKSIVNIGIGGILIFLIIGKMYNAGEAIGEFLYNINH